MRPARTADVMDGYCTTWGCGGLWNCGVLGFWGCGVVGLWGCVYSGHVSLLPPQRVALAEWTRVRVAAEALARGGFTVCAPDFAGHGLSGGQRGFIHSAEQLEADALLFVEAAQQAHPQLPLFLAGSSMGGAIAFQAALTLGGQVRGLVLLAPMLAPAASAGAQVLWHCASALSPWPQLCHASPSACK